MVSILSYVFALISVTLLAYNTALLILDGNFGKLKLDFPFKGKFITDVIISSLRLGMFWTSVVFWTSVENTLFVLIFVY